MFDAMSYLKDRLESETIEFYEKWHMLDRCDQFIPADTNIEEFEADQAEARLKETAAVQILATLKNTIGSVPSSIIGRTQELYNSVGNRRFDKAAHGVIETVGFGFDPSDATEFVEAIESSLLLSLADS
jgi:hypothetical protein